MNTLMIKFSAFTTTYSSFMSVFIMKTYPVAWKSITKYWTRKSRDGQIYFLSSLFFFFRQL